MYFTASTTVCRATVGTAPLLVDYDDRGGRDAGGGFGKKAAEQGILERLQDQLKQGTLETGDSDLRGLMKGQREKYRKEQADVERRGRQG